MPSPPSPLSLCAGEGEQELALAELTPAAELAWRIAALEARRGRSPSIVPDHLLIGLLSLEKLLEPAAGLAPERRQTVQLEQDGLTRALGQIGMDAVALRREIRAGLTTGSARLDASIHRDPACRAIFDGAMQLATERGNVSCSTLHLLASALSCPVHQLPRPLQESPTGLPSAGERLHTNVLAELARLFPDSRTRPWPGPPPGPLPLPPDPDRDVSPPWPQPAPAPWPDPQPAPPAPIPSPRPLVPPVLLRFGRDLTAEAEAGRLGPVIGRREEMLQVVRVLHRRTKNSPVLVGEAGVGKTAVVEGLARRIAEGTALAGRRIVALNLASVVAGTSYRGQFEERLEEILAALRERPDVILFLDELHAIVGAGDQEGRLDVASILKPALARGEIACIGATTLDEYRKHIEGDAALERRFQPVMVAEPSPAETLEILAGLREELERHHAVAIEADALEAAVALTTRYVTQRRLPDKAVDALDEACARVSVPTLTRLPGQTGEEGDARPTVTRQTVAEVVAAWVGVPLGQIGRAEAEQLADLEARLGERVVGQGEAVAQVAQRVRMSRTGLADPNRPAGVFLFLGPSGVGKTALAQALAEALRLGPASANGGVDRAAQTPLIRLDMSEYGEKLQMSRLIGAPPGYQGYEEEGQLTGPLRRTPRAVVLLDEVEKAHPEAIDLFLQLFDAGRLTDGRGRLVDGRQAIFVLTSNLVVSGAGRRALGFGRETGQSAATDRAALLPELLSFFRPELLNRIDEVVVFRPLGEPELREIVERRVDALRQRLLSQHQIELRLSDASLGYLAARAAAGSGGAREAQRLVSRHVEEPLSRLVLDGKVPRREHLLVTLRDDALQIVPDNETI